MLLKCVSSDPAFHGPIPGIEKYCYKQSLDQFCSFLVFKKAFLSLYVIFSVGDIWTCVKIIEFWANFCCLLSSKKSKSLLSSTKQKRDLTVTPVLSEWPKIIQKVVVGNYKCIF